MYGGELRLEYLGTIPVVKQVNKNILYENVNWWHIGLKENGGAKNTETR